MLNLVKIFSRPVPYPINAPKGSEMWKIDKDVLHAYNLGTTTTLSKVSEKHNQIRARIGTSGGGINLYGAKYSDYVHDLEARALVGYHLEESGATYLHDYDNNYLIIIKRGKIVNRGYIEADLENLHDLKEAVLGVDK